MFNYEKTQYLSYDSETSNLTFRKNYYTFLEIYITIIPTNLNHFPISDCFDPLSSPYECSQCGVKCSSMSNIKAHYKRYHPTNLTEVKEKYPNHLKQRCEMCYSVFIFGLDKLKRHNKTCKKVKKG